MVNSPTTTPTTELDNTITSPTTTPTPELDRTIVSPNGAGASTSSDAAGSVEGRASSNNLAQILEVNRRVIALQRELAEQQKARAELQQQNDQYERDLLLLRSRSRVTSPMPNGPPGETPAVMSSLMNGGTAQVTAPPADASAYATTAGIQTPAAMHLISCTPAVTSSITTSAVASPRPHPAVLSGQSSDFAGFPAVVSASSMQLLPGGYWNTVPAVVSAPSCCVASAITSASSTSAVQAASTSSSFGCVSTPAPPTSIYQSSLSSSGLVCVVQRDQMGREYMQLVPIVHASGVQTQSNPPITNINAQMPSTSATPIFCSMTSSGMIQPLNPPMPQMPSTSATPIFCNMSSPGMIQPYNPPMPQMPSTSAASAFCSATPSIQMLPNIPTINPQMPSTSTTPVFSSATPSGTFLLPASTIVVPTTQQDSRMPDARFRQELPTFSGRPEDWPLFSGSFKLTTERYGLNDLDNLLRLQKSLTGEARKTVEAMLIQPQHVGQVMAALEAAFGRPDQLIRSQIRLAQEQQAIDDAHLERLVPFSVVVQNLAMYLDSATTQHHLSNPTLLDELVSKLPMSRRLEWAAVALNIQPYPSVKHFANWLQGVARLISAVAPQSTMAKPTASTSSSGPPLTRSKHVLLNVQRDAHKHQTAGCNFCGEQHNTHSCKKFLRLTMEDRWHEVSKRPLCYGCLGDDHLLPSCPVKKRCGVEGCTRWHVPQLHKPNDTRRGESSTSASGTSGGRQPSADLQAATSHQRDAQESGDPSRILSCRGAERCSRPKGTLLFRVVPVVLYGNQNQMRNSFALLDEGSSISLIDASMAEELKLDGAVSDLNVQWFGSQSAVESSKKVALHISGVQVNARHINLQNVRTIRNLTLPTQSVRRAELLDNNPHLADIPFEQYVGAVPKILLGLDHHHVGVPRQIRTGELEDGIFAAETKIGWILYGSDGRPALPSATVLMNVTHDDDESYAQLHELVQQHFTTEDFGVKVPKATAESDDIIRARGILAATTKRIGPRFETGLLWRDDYTKLPASFDMALRRLTSVETKMKRDAEYAEQYRQQIQAYLDKGYARQLSDAEADVRSDRTWFLPHFAVCNANKPGKFRLVFDAAAKASGVSLNSALLAGPDINVPLVRLLFRFRLGAVGVCGDIKEMYHQVLVRREDQDAQRFLWRDGDSTAQPSVYIMNVMTFGATCSPSSAQHIKNANADEFDREMPEAADAVRQCHYVDDYVSSFATPEDATRITEQVIELHRRGGFHLRGIVSSDANVQRRFNGDETPNQPVSMEPVSTDQKILGMSWDTGDDSFRFQTRFVRVRPDVVDGTKRPTKREILSTAMSIFDPFGLLADFVITSKVLLQELWRLGTDWDEPVPETIDDRWQAWRAQIERTQLVRVPRCYSRHIRSTTDLQLHVFADASEVAFAAVAFWRIRVGEEVELAFVAGKAKCAPTKILSIPRLELQAAVLATRLMLEVRESHDIPVGKTVFWSDSETVLKWLRCDRRRYKPFVAFRVAEVVENAPAACWRWVPTAQNVADDATRARHPPSFDPDSRWLRGPAWLRADEDTWPMQKKAGAETPDDDEELRPRFVGLVSCRGPVEYERFSRYQRLCRTTAWVRRFLTNARTRDPALRIKGELSADEVREAVRQLVRLVQREAFADELAALEAGNAVERQSSVFILKPYVDEAGLLRVHGRTDAADELHMSRDAKRPLLLPRDHRFSALLVRNHHERLAHQLVDATIAAVRNEFWVPRLRALVRQVQHACQLCRLRNAKPIVPSQGQLPRDRLDAYARPFTNTGLDFFGPISVTVGRRHEKRWVALFTCLTVRAVHLEIAADLSTDAVLLCIRNLCNTRGVPALIRCDNGTNFVGAHNELERETSFFEPESIQRDLTTRGVEWRFNCPGNPEAGGAWERLVQSVKRVLRVILHEEAPRTETLRAVLLEAANIINSRPLTHLEVEPGDSEPLTPNHFLIGGPNVATIPNPADVEPKATRKQWQICRGLSRRFWQQWVRDYLPELTRRNKHYPEQPPLRVDDLVVICDDRQPRGRWVRGRIVEVVAAKDGAVRTATVQTADGVLRRPSTKLARLDVGPSPKRSTDGGRNVAI